jgi:hypothetical protein
MYQRRSRCGGEERIKVRYSRRVLGLRLEEE